MFCIEGSYVICICCGYCLMVYVILGIIIGKDVFDVGFGSFVFGYDVVGFVYIQLIFEDCCIWFMANGYKEVFDWDDGSFFGLVVDDMYVFYFFFVKDFFGFCILVNFDIFGVYYLFLYDFRSLQFVLVYQYVYFWVEFGKV